MHLSLTPPEQVGAWILLNNARVGCVSFLQNIKISKKLLRMDDAEMKSFGLTVKENGAMEWDEEKSADTRDFEVTEGAYNYIVDTLKDLDAKKNMHVNLLPLALKILAIPESQKVQVGQKKLLSKPRG